MCDSYSSGVSIISDFFLRPRFFGWCASWGLMPAAPFITRFIWWCCGPGSAPGGVDVGVPSPGWAPPGHVMFSGLPPPPPPGLLAVLMPPIDISSSTNEYGSTGVSHFIATWKRAVVSAELRVFARCHFRRRNNEAIRSFRIGTTSLALVLGPRIGRLV